MRAAAEFVGAVMMALALLGAMGVVGFEVRIGGPAADTRKTHLCAGQAGHLSARAYRCTEAEYRQQQQRNQQPKEGR